MKNKNWFWGIFLILAGVLVVVSQLGYFADFGFWTICAAIALLALLIQSLFSRNLFGVVLPLAFLYMIFQKPLGWMYISPWLLLLAAALLGTGLSMLFRRRPKAPPPYPHEHRQNEYTNDDSTVHVEENHTKNRGFTIDVTLDDDDKDAPPMGDENNPYIKTSFTSTTRYLHSTNLRSGQFYTSFGSLEVYFTQATLAPEGASIYVDCSFGSLSLYVPRHWRVIDKVERSLTTSGGTEGSGPAPNPAPNAPVLTLTGDVSFGNMEINYV